MHQSTKLINQSINQSINRLINKREFSLPNRVHDCFVDADVFLAHQVWLEEGLSHLKPLFTDGDDARVW